MLVLCRLAGGVGGVAVHRLSPKVCASSNDNCPEIDPSTPTKNHVRLGGFTWPWQTRTTSWPGFSPMTRPEWARFPVVASKWRTAAAMTDRSRRRRSSHLDRFASIPSLSHARPEDRLCNSRPAAEYYLRTLWQAEQPLKFLLLSVAPPGQLGGEAGNRICGEFIDSYHPSLCVVVGQTEKRGFQQTAHTLAINPGRLADGSLAWLDRSRIRNEQVELLRL
jgi:hypothetical protein